jgi:hypothetical protein
MIESFSFSSFHVVSSVDSPPTGDGSFEAPMERRAPSAISRRHRETCVARGNSAASKPLFSVINVSRGIRASNRNDCTLTLAAAAAAAAATRAEQPRIDGDPLFGSSDQTCNFIDVKTIVRTARV